MSRPLFTALAAVFGLSTLAGCSHFHRSEPVYTPVVHTPAPTPEPTYTRKWR